MDQEQKLRLEITRRQLFGLTAKGIGVAALASLLTPRSLLGETSATDPRTGGLSGLPHFPAKAKRVIFLFQAGAPSQVDLFDYKPGLKALHGAELPESVRKGPPLLGMGGKTRQGYPVAASPFGFRQCGKSGVWISELLPHTAGIADEIAIVRSVQSEAVNHEPGITFLQTGFPLGGRPSMGAWVTYGLGSENRNLPSFVVLASKANAPDSTTPLTVRYWSAGFMSSKYQGIAFRSSSDPVPYLSNPPGVNTTIQRRVLDDLARLNQMSYEKYLDPEIEARIAQYEMAYRMQSSVPDLMDLSKEPESVFEMYGQDARKPGTYAANCLLARRLAERDVRFIQLYHRGWDQHNNLIRDIQLQCKGVDQPSSALIRDLKQRGLTDDTLVIWAGEFGRTVYTEQDSPDKWGRDHHGKCFTVWMAGGGIKPGISYGETDDFSYNVIRDAVSVHDLQATILHCLGIDHTRLIYRFQGRRFRLTDISGDVVKEILL